MRAEKTTAATGYTGSTAYAEFEITPEGTLELYSDASLQTPIDSGGLSLTEAADLYVKCTTALSGLEGTTEMKVAATSSDATTLAIGAVEKLGEYADGYCTYKIRLNPVRAGTADISLWGYVSVNSRGDTAIGTLTTVLSTEVDVLPSTLTLGEGALETLAGIEMLDGPVVVDLIYSGRELGDITPEEVTVSRFKDISGVGHGNYQPTEDIKASYDPTNGKLTVEPVAYYLYKLRITVAGAGLYGEATIEIPVTVSRITPTITATLASNGRPLPEVLELLPGEQRDIALTYSGEGMTIVANTVESTNPAAAEIIDYLVSPDKKGAVLTVRASAVSPDPVGLRIRVDGDVLHYRPIDFRFTVKVSKTDLALVATPDELELGVGESGTVAISNDGDRAIGVASSDEDVATATFDYDTMELTVEALRAGSADITVSAAESSTLSASTATVTVVVTKAGQTLTVSPDELALKIGESGTSQVTYEGDGAIAVASSDEDVATATFDADTMALTVEALRVGNATITLSAAETATSEATEATVAVTVTAAGELSVSPGKLALKVGESGTASVTYGGDGAIEVSSSNATVATATFDTDTMALTVEALRTGTATITLSAAKTAISEAAEATVTVTVTAAGTTGKAPAPELLITGTEYALVVGGGSWKVQCSEALRWESSPAGVLEVASSDDAKELTVSAKAKGIAVLKLWTEETATTLPMAPTYFLFTATKQLVELNALSLSVGARATSTVSLLDEDGNPITGAVSTSSANAQVATASYDPATGSFTVLAVAEGQTVINLGSEAAREDYTMKVTVRTPVTPPVAGVVIDTGSTGVEVTGTLKNIPEGAQVNGTVKTLTSGAAYDSIVTKAKGRGEDLLGAYDFTLLIDGEEIYEDFGTLTLALPVDATYKDSEVTVWQLHHDGRLTSESVWVQDGKATVKVTDLSVFAVTAKAKQDNSNNNTDSTNSNNTGSPGSNNTGTLVSNSGSTGNSGSSGTLVSSSGSSGNSGSSGTLGTSQSSAKDSQAKDALNDDGDTVNALDEADVPLSTSSALDEAEGNGQQGGTNPWTSAVLIGLALVALAAVLWFILRRRRRRLEEAFAEA